jgi:trehalose/maltose hydrolase-like predicted phosphorylase/hydroxymethylpyrimidine pyrophosphatase-like HAD family hydrolase
MTVESSAMQTTTQYWPQPVERPFKIIVLDWDGTAVENREEDVTVLRERFVRLLQLGVRIVITSGTHVENIDDQLCKAIHDPAKARLFICANRGSESYGYGPDGSLVLLVRRQATPEEDRLLTEIANAVRDTIVKRTGLEIDVVYDRLNRRKLDLIPIPEWADPPKERIGELRAATDARLENAGFAGGIAGVVELAQQIAAQQGMPDARITSDAKNVEIGLTDKSDAMEWIMDEVAKPAGIAAEEILIAGDEFGPVGGTTGSDARMLIPSVSEATAVTVGPEPLGLPAGVLHLPGGPHRFLGLMELQISRWTTKTLEAEPAEDTWLLTFDGLDPKQIDAIGSICSVSNGYIGTRASLPEGFGPCKAGSFIAGVYDYFRHPGPVPELIHTADWLAIRISIDGESLSSDNGTILDWHRILDLRRAVTTLSWRHRDASGRITAVRLLHFVSLDDPRILIQRLTLTPENYTGSVSVELALDGALAIQRETHRDFIGEIHRSVRPRADAHLVTVPDGGDELTLKAVGSGVVVSEAVSGSPEEIPDVTSVSITGIPTRAGKTWSWDATEGNTYRLDKVVSVATSREEAEPAILARARLHAAAGRGVSKLLTGHEMAWQRRWAEADIQLDGEARMQRAVRLAIYHLTGASNRDDEHVSVGARGLTGDAYKGHVFWDTETFMAPFYVLSDPAAARSMLMYRFHTLPAARAKAKRFGYRGALYAWESAANGEDATPTEVIGNHGEIIPISSGAEEQHISADVCYAVWQYWQATRDESFMVDAGAEIICETARFWASRAHSSDDGRFHIDGIEGPDEYHNGVTDNVYTNLMARFNLRRALDVTSWLSEHHPPAWQRLREHMQLSAKEIEAWRTVANELAVPIDETSGLLEEFAGYFGLEEIDLATIPHNVPPDVTLGADRVQTSQIVKQPDVLMALFLLWDEFDVDVHRANYAYYDPRTAHGSSLSSGIHAAFAARLGELEAAETYLERTAAVDIDDHMGNADGGVHLGAQGSLWQAVVFGFMGLRLTDDALVLQPRLAKSWKRVRCTLHWRGRRLVVEVASGADTWTLRLDAGPAVLLTTDDASIVTLNSAAVSDGMPCGEVVRITEAGV